MRYPTCMPPEFSEQAQQVFPLFGILLAGILGGMSLERFLSRKRRQVWRESDLPLNIHPAAIRAFAVSVTPLGAG
jgi:hypothetical protein